MSPAAQIRDPRIDELLLEQAVCGLDEQLSAELLRAGCDDPLDNPYMQAAGIAQVALHAMHGRQHPELQSEQMPAELRTRLLASARRQLPPSDAGNPQILELNRAQRKKAETRARRTSLGFRDLGWAVAAMLAIALVLPGTDSGSDIRQSRESLLKTASDAVTWPWAGQDDPRFASVSGDVVWSDGAQTGFMRLSGLPANNPARQQYQLWIVDPERAAQPVDGGVFDIPPGEEQVIIPINAKLPVDAPAAFAITLEKPGGVVVSEGPLLVVATPG